MYESGKLKIEGDVVKGTVTFTHSLIGPVGAEIVTTVKDPKELARVAREILAALPAPAQTPAVVEATVEADKEAA